MKNRLLLGLGIVICLVGLMLPRAAHASTPNFTTTRNATLCPFGDRYILTEDSWNIHNHTNHAKYVHVHTMQDGKKDSWRVRVPAKSSATVLLYVQKHGKILATYHKVVILFQRTQGVCF